MALFHIIWQFIFYFDQIYILLIYLKTEQRGYWLLMYFTLLSIYEPKDDFFKRNVNEKDAYQSEEGRPLHM